MKSIHKDEFDSKIKTVFDSVFTNVNPYGKPFHPKINPRLLLYSFRWSLDSPWIDPITEAINALGEDGFYVTVFSRPQAGGIPENYGHWYVPVNEIEEYRSTVFSQENAIYSLSGQWGIVCSDFDHALLGGPQLLIDKIQKYVLDLDNRVIEFLNVWKYYNEKQGIDIEWILPQLEHIYGFDRACSLIKEANLSRLLNIR